VEWRRCRADDVTALTRLLEEHEDWLAVERGLARLECSVPTTHQPTAEHFLLERGFEIVEATTYRWSVLEGKHPRLPTPIGVRRARRVPA